MRNEVTIIKSTFKKNNAKLGTLACRLKGNDDSPTNV